jgi:hypothetical protein
MTDPREIEVLIEEAVGAWRERAPTGEIRPHPAWADLDAASRERVYEETARARALERAIDRAGLGTTARVVLARIRGRR